MEGDPQIAVLMSDGTAIGTLSGRAKFDNGTSVAVLFSAPPEASEPGVDTILCIPGGGDKATLSFTFCPADQSVAMVGWMVSTTGRPGRDVPLMVETNSPKEVTITHAYTSRESKVSLTASLHWGAVPKTDIETTDERGVNSGVYHFRFGVPKVPPTKVVEGETFADTEAELAAVCKSIANVKAVVRELQDKSSAAYSDALREAWDAQDAVEIMLRVKKLARGVVNKIAALVCAPKKRSETHVEEYDEDSEESVGGAGGGLFGDDDEDWGGGGYGGYVPRGGGYAEGASSTFRKAASAASLSPIAKSSIPRSLFEPSSSRAVLSGQVSNAQTHTVDASSIVYFASLAMEVRFVTPRFAPVTSFVTRGAPAALRLFGDLHKMKLALSNEEARVRRVKDSIADDVSGIWDEADDILKRAVGVAVDLADPVKRQRLCLPGTTYSYAYGTGVSVPHIVKTDPTSWTLKLLVPLLLRNDSALGASLAGLLSATRTNASFLGDTVLDLLVQLQSACQTAL